MDIGQGIAFGSSVLGCVAVIYKVFPAKNGNGFSKALCDQMHKAIDDKLERAETDRKEVLGYLRRIEEKLDDHISEDR